MSDTDQAWYFNLATREVERGKVSDWTNRMGPYDSAEAAAAALATAARRSEEWDAQDAADE